MEADPAVVFTTCFQRVPKGWTVKKVTGCLLELASKSLPGDQPLVSFYQVGVRMFLEVVSAKQHIYQRAKTSKYPAPSDGQSIQSLKSSCTPMPAPAGGCAQIPSIPESRSPSPEIPNPESRTSVADAATRFQEFWQIYPLRHGKKVEKAATEARFLKLSVQDQILAVTAARNYAEALKHQGLSPKDPKRFLRDGHKQEPWRDYIEPALPSPIPQRPPPCPPKIDPIARGQWKQAYGDPKAHGYD
jgi:hypothetical protein